MHNMIAPNAAARVGCAFSLVGYDLKIVELPTERSLLMAIRGQIDGDFGRVEEVFLQYPKELVKVDEPVAEVELWVYAREGVIAGSLSELRPYGLVSMLGVRYFDRFEREGFLMAGRSSSVLGAFQMIQAGRGDYTIWAKNSILERRRANLKDDVRLLFDKPVEKKKLYLGLHARHLEYADNIAQALRDEQCRLSLSREKK